MHCDDKRTIFSLSEQIEKTWTALKDSDFQDKESLRNLVELISDYSDYKKSVKQ